MISQAAVGLGEEERKPQRWPHARHSAMMSVRSRVQQSGSDNRESRCSSTSTTAPVVECVGGSSRDVTPIGGGDFAKYKYVIAVFDRRRHVPLCFVTLENSPLASNVLCVFEKNGSHSNYGTLSGPNLKQKFINKGVNLIRERFNLGELREMVARPQRPWWKFW
jgi:hypothetical protein